MNNNTSVTMAIAVAGILTLAAVAIPHHTKHLQEGSNPCCDNNDKKPCCDNNDNKQTSTATGGNGGSGGVAELAEKAEMADITTTKIPKNRKSIRMQMADMPMGVTVVTPMVATHAPNIKYANKS